MTDRVPPRPAALPTSSSVLPIAVILLTLPLAPLSLRAVNALMGTADRNRSYLPSIENRAARKSFDPGPIDSLRHGNPRWVFIGDSMLGTRIHPTLLKELSETGDRNVMVLLQAASGPSWWYLAFKNLLVPSGIKPRMTFFFFRDTNLTDTMFRLTNLGDALDEVAHQTEPELDRIAAARSHGPWWWVDATLERLYQVNITYAWLHPTIRRWYALWKYPDPSARLRFETEIEDDFNSNFRRDLTADLGAVDEDVNFRRDLPTSVLPLIMRLSTEHQIPVCFVRVQRRPVGNRPLTDTPGLQRYIADFRAWADAQHACFYDETGDPELTEDLYGDGDHVEDRLRYTRIFRKRLDPLFR
jgi:hypothetical protein